MKTETALNLSEIENSNLRKHLLWAASYLSPDQRHELAARLKAPEGEGGVVPDLDAADREYELSRHRSLEALTDHIQKAIDRGADDAWIATADALATHAREYLLSPKDLTFYELLNPSQDITTSTHPRHPEYQYLDLMQKILDHGDRRIDRTGVGTLSLFGAMMRFDVSKTIPLLTTKRVYWKTAFKEMLWFLTGETSIRPLLEQNVHIWTDWPLARYRQETGENISMDDFERRVLEDKTFADRYASTGPGYGFQWRNWIGQDGKRHDQIATVIKTLRENPTSRRILFHAWNVSDIDKMALPPCHILYQFHVSNGKLNCILFQRSVDVLLGLPFNVVNATALLYMIAQQTNLLPGELIWTGGDTHLYLNHLDQARLQLQRKPRPFPTMTINRHPESIDHYRIEDFTVDGYDPHPPIAADVAV